MADGRQIRTLHLNERKGSMPLLHIEHAITDFATWKAAFDRFAPARASFGVLNHRVYRPHDDPTYVMIDLEFGQTEEAEAFLGFLHDRVWSSREASPGLGGEPQTRILELEETA
jgi:hypothetical protein